MSVTHKKGDASTVGGKQSGAGRQDIAPRSILERVQAFVELRFPVSLKELKLIKDEKMAKTLESEQLQDLVSFFLNEFEYEDAVHFLQVAFQDLRRKKMEQSGKDPGPADKEADIVKLIKFKPAHASFRKLQETYVDARLHLTELLMKG